MPIRVFLIDDHNIVRDGIRMILGEQPDMEVVGEAPDGRDALAKIIETNPDIVTTDIEMPGMDGISIAKKIKTRDPRIKVLVLTAHSEPSRIGEALQAGVNGYLLKINAGRDLIQAIRTVHTGQVYLSPEISTVLVREYQRQIHSPAALAVTGVLTDREKEILAHIANGKNTKEIALSLNLSSKTIEAHRLNIMAKLKINNVAELTKYALREGIVHL